MPSVQAAHARNYELSLSEEFTSWMVATLRQQFVRVLRIHVSGDFYSHDYVRKWYQIAAAAPEVRMLAYTRSWRDDALLPSLVKFGKLDNVRLWWSQDRETGPAPLVSGIKRAYMAMNDSDAATAPVDVDLVFRNNPDTVMKRTPVGTQVCPPENGVPTKSRITCSLCGICWRGDRKSEWESQLRSLMDNHTACEITAPAIQGRKRRADTAKKSQRGNST